MLLAVASTGGIGTEVCVTATPLMPFRRSAVESPCDPGRRPAANILAVPRLRGGLNSALRRSKAPAAAGIAHNSFFRT